ncbi:MAG: 50S ribosomal protein L5 [Candidatus Nanoarchaeia archaeon]|nr:50S ribosomal protein L5 [Candidatus Nanoarchaeia archaeon]
MKQIKIEKITLNIGTGEPGVKLENARYLLNKITGLKAVECKSQKRIPTWGVRPGLAIGCKVTLRKEKAEALLKRLFTAVENKISIKKFDSNGNFAFGIAEYLDIPDVEYDSKIGIIGLEVAVTLERAGYRIKRRTIHQAKISKKHLITKDDAIKFVNEKFGVEVI